MLKPAASTVRLYVAGRREGMTYRPSVSVTAVREKAVASWVAMTLAEATAAPLGSVTLPAMLPKPCACANSGANRRAKRTISTLFFISIFLFVGCPRHTPRPSHLRPHSVCLGDTPAPFAP